MRSKTVLSILTLALCSGALSGCGCDSPEEQGSQESALGPGGGRVVETFLIGIRAYNESNLEELLASYHKDIEWHVPTTKVPPIRGRTAVARKMIRFKALVPDSRIGVKRILEDGNTLAVQAVLLATGHNVGGMPGARDKKLGFEMLYMVETDQGKSRKVYHYYNQAAVRRQVGALKGAPPPVPAWPGVPEVVREKPDPEGLAEAKRLYSLWESGDLDGIDDMVSDDFAVADHRTGTRIDLAEFKDKLKQGKRSVSKGTFRITQSASAGPYTAVRFVQEVANPSGNEGDASVEPARVRLHGAHVFTFHEGEMVELEVYMNDFELLRKLGAPAGQSGADAGVPAQGDETEGGARSADAG